MFSTATRMHRAYGVVLILSALFLVMLWSGCNDKKSSSGGGGTVPTSTSFTGIFTNGTENGSLYLTVNTTTLAPKVPFHQTYTPASVLSPRSKAPEAIVTASGSMKIVGGGMVSLTGGYDNEADTLYMSGGSYTFRGQTDTGGSNPSISGQYDGPNGVGFFGALTGVVGAAPYCGTFSSGTTPLTGTWDFLIGNGKIQGVGVPSGGSPLDFEGTVDVIGTTGTIAAGSNNGSDSLSVHGTLNTLNHTVSGTWYLVDIAGGGVGNDNGTWSGNLCP